jgi:hypothetical protein
MKGIFRLHHWVPSSACGAREHLERSRRSGWGALRFRACLQQRIQYHFQHRRGFGKHLVVPESQDAIAGSGDPRIADLVLRGLLLVLAAVQFNHQLCVEAGEICDVAADGNLTAKTMAGQLFVAQVAPQQAFGIGGLNAQFTCAGLRQRVAQGLSAILVAPI